MCVEVGGVGKEVIAVVLEVLLVNHDGDYANLAHNNVSAQVKEAEVVIWKAAKGGLPAGRTGPRLTLKYD